MLAEVHLNTPTASAKPRRALPVVLTVSSHQSSSASALGWRERGDGAESLDFLLNLA
jgi:hypothetical protein